MDYQSEVVMSDKSVQLILRLTADLHAAVKAASAEDRRSLNAEIVYLLEQMLEVRLRRIARQQTGLEDDPPAKNPPDNTL